MGYNETNLLTNAIAAGDASSVKDLLAAGAKPSYADIKHALAQENSAVADAIKENFTENYQALFAAVKDRNFAVVKFIDSAVEFDMNKIINNLTSVEWEICAKASGHIFSQAEKSHNSVEQIMEIRNANESLLAFLDKDAFHFTELLINLGANPQRLLWIDSSHSFNAKGVEFLKKYIPGVEELRGLSVDKIMTNWQDKPMIERLLSFASPADKLGLFKHYANQAASVQIMESAKNNPDLLNQFVDTAVQQGSDSYYLIERLMKLGIDKDAALEKAIDAGNYRARSQLKEAGAEVILAGDLKNFVMQADSARQNQLKAMLSNKEFKGKNVANIPTDETDLYPNLSRATFVPETMKTNMVNNYYNDVANDHPIAKAVLAYADNAANNELITLQQSTGDKVGGFYRPLMNIIVLDDLKIHSSTIHEFTHYAMEQLFHNTAKPYYNNIKSEQAFRGAYCQTLVNINKAISGKIFDAESEQSCNQAEQTLTTTNIETNRGFKSFDWIGDSHGCSHDILSRISSLFTFYKSDMFDVELIVKYPELLTDRCANKEQVEEILKPLGDYFHDVILPLMGEQIEA